MLLLLLLKLKVLFVFSMDLANNSPFLVHAFVDGNSPDFVGGKGAL